MQYAFFDVHSHLHDKAFSADQDTLIEQMRVGGVGTILVGTDQEESSLAVKLAEQHDHLFATVGLHPADTITEVFDTGFYEGLAQSPKVVAIGECGLDYHYIENFFDKDMKEKGLVWTKEEEKERQKKIFQEQISLAVKLNKPLMLHGRPSKKSMDAYEDMLEMLEEAKKGNETLRGNAHFFVGNIDIAKRFLDIGFTMSFPGVITFTHDYDDVVDMFRLL